MSTFFPERRRIRPSEPQKALLCFLEATRRRSDGRSVALADSLGMLVAGAGPARECEELAAWAPVVLGGRTPPGGLPFELSGAKVPGFDAYVCVQGLCAEPALVNAAAGCSRILNAQS
jgi:hypothetical protein